MTKEEAKKIKNLIKNVDATENSYSFVCKMIDGLVTKEQPYWQTDTPTEDGLYVVKFKRWNLDSDLGYMCVSIKNREMYDEITGDALSKIYAVKWHKIQPSEESSVTEMDNMQEILEKFSALCRKYQAESDCEDCPCWFGECQLRNFMPEEYDKVIQANIDATEPEEL